jgi:hypothetical protein
MSMNNRRSPLLLALIVVGLGAATSSVFLLRSSTGQAAAPSPPIASTAPRPSPSAQRSDNDGERETGPDGEDRHVSRQREAIARHEAEPLDREWSQSAAHTIRKDLTALGKGNHFRISEVDCRTHSCVATLVWSDYDTAIREWQPIITHSYGVPCGTSIYLAEPADRKLPYRADAIYSCSRE